MAKGRERTFNAVHMDIFNPMLADGKYQMPIVLPTDHIPPRDEDKDQAISNRDFVDWVKKK